jgi:hypothetical protein
MSNFYVLKPKGGRFGTKWAYGEAANPEKIGGTASQRCPVCGAGMGMLQWLPPHYLQLSSAKPEKWGDFLWGTVFPMMVSGRFKTLYESEHLSGITTFYPPATIVHAGRKKTRDLPFNLPTYHLVDVVWNGANLDDELSGVVRKRLECEYHRGAVEVVEQIVLEANSWTGADIFEARGLPGRILVSERFKQVVDQHNLTNVFLVPAEKYTYDEHRPGGWQVREDT